MCHGKPCIREMRIPVSFVLDLVASGMTIKEILEDYPYLEEDDIKQCLKYASFLANERVIEFASAAEVSA